MTEELCEELPGIFNWALDGLSRLRARGRFQQPEISRDAIREMEDLASPTGAFVRDCCRVGPDCMVAVDHLYKRYREWCDEYGRHPVNRQVFGRDLRAVRPEIRIVRPRLGGNRERQYVGITIGRTADHADRADVVRVVRDPPHCTTENLICAHCGEPALPDDSILEVYVGGEAYQLHRGCQMAWFQSDSDEARLQ